MEGGSSRQAIWDFLTAGIHAQAQHSNLLVLHQSWPVREEQGTYRRGSGKVDGHVNRIPYQRGLMYFMRLAYQLKTAEARTLDELIFEMVDLRNSGKPHGIAIWLSIIEAELGTIASTDYYAMSDADPIILPPDCIKVIENKN